MQSQRKNLGSYFNTKQPQSSKSFPCSRKKLSVASQTLNYPDIELCNLSSMSTEEVKDVYSKTLYFLNNCHEYFNNLMTELSKSKLQSDFDFQIPAVPNYFSILEIFLMNKSETLKVPENANREFQNKNEYERNLIDLDVYNLRPKKIGDGPESTLNNEPDVIMPNAKEKVRRKKSRSPSRKIKTDTTTIISENSSIPEFKALSTAFEEIIRTCNVFQSKSKRSFQNKALLEDESKLEGHQEVHDDSPGKQINLLEYTLNKQATKTIKVMDSGTEPDLKQHYSNDKISKLLLNEASQTKSPTRVNEMFKKISHESLGRPDRPYITDLGLSSSSDSIILNDEEFERKNGNNCIIWANEKWSVKSEPLEKDNLLKEEYKDNIKEKRLKSHPLLLTERDKSQLDKNVIKAMGLFTENGDIRPAVIHMLEEKQRIPEDPTRNVKFRTKRKYSPEQPCNSERSFCSFEDSLSGNSIVHGSNVTLRSIEDCRSASTISDSDLLGAD